MALSDEDYAELEAAIASGELDPAVAAQAKAALSKRGGSVTPAPENSLGVTGVINQPEAPLSPEDSEVGRIAAALDPRFDLIPQSLALLPATNDTRGVEGYKAGTTGPVKYAYEPPVSVVRKQLLENPAMLGLLRGDPPSPEEIAALDSDSPLYKDAANYMWARTMEAAQKGGYTVYRHSQLPWGNEDASFENLGLKLGGMMAPVTDLKNAFVLGADDTGMFGAARAIQETASPEQSIQAPGGDIDVMGLDESVPQKTADLNQSNIEEHPVAYGAGQVTGAVVGAPQAIFKGILEGGSKLAQLVARTRLGATAPAAVKGAAGLAGEVGAGTVEGLATQAGQELVDAGAAAAQGREPVLGAGERVLDTGESAALWSLGGGLLGRLAGGGANAIRHSDRLGQGAVGRTENNLDWGLGSTLTGPRLKGDTKEMVKRARIEGNEPGDYIAEKIAPPILKKAQERTSRAEGAQRAERANYYQTTEGGERLPATNLQTMSLEKLRSHHQPEPGGGLHPVDDKYRDAQRVFNRHVQSVSLEPVEGAIKLTPDEAGTFLGPNARHKLIADDIEAAGSRAQGSPPADIKRDEYLQTIDSRKRAAAEEEIDAAIEDIVGDRAPTPAARAKAEQRVLREFVEEASFTEANGPLGDYLRQRGVEAVYVTPRAYDARRTDTLIDGLSDKELKEAAKLDRARRPLKGKKGGYSERLDEHADEIAAAKKVEESIAPKGDAFKAVAQQGNKPTAGSKVDKDVMSELADKAGVRPDLDRLRSLQESLGVRRQAWGRRMSGASRGVLDPNNWMDAAALRAFPTLRALEPGGEVTGGMMSRMALMGQVEDEAARQAEQDKAKPAYEKRRAQAQKQKDTEREKQKKERERRRTEKHRDD